MTYLLREVVKTKFYGLKHNSRIKEEFNITNLGLVTRYLGVKFCKFSTRLSYLNRNMPKRCSKNLV
jgi:hypothetical protein